MAGRGGRPSGHRTGDPAFGGAGDRGRATGGAFDTDISIGSYYLLTGPERKNKSPVLAFSAWLRNQLACDEAGLPAAGAA
ncbi:MAG: hypothetical protein HPM95_07310 [Alphaproteobacteria bacterium]|nr:hypothetical protein [Alphaproteobacteria bacterium]